MKFNNVNIAAIGYELPNLVVTSDMLEENLAPVYAALRIPRGQLVAMTGIRERRWWPPNTKLSDVAARAGLNALRNANVATSEIGMVIYAGVCRENLEPATACAVADKLGITGNAQIFDISNACLGAMNGVVQIATAIEAGVIRAGIVCCAETAQQIVEIMLNRLLDQPSMPLFKTTLATLTGGSGAAAILVAHKDLAPDGHKLIGGAIRNSVRHHELCRWGPDTGQPATAPMTMETHAIDVLENGVALGRETWRDFLRAVETHPDKVICHQVGQSNRDAILRALEISAGRDFSTFPTLGNIGTVSLPLTAAIAAEQGHLQRHDRVAFLGIGSGLNCLMLAVDW
ncbi:MAG: 3-oxoacyl-ACP synthase III [Phycisphaerae bacterium]